jgi:hypothetical protein
MKSQSAQQCNTYDFRNLLMADMEQQEMILREDQETASQTHTPTSYSRRERIEREFCDHTSKIWSHLRRPLTMRCVTYTEMTITCERSDDLSTRDPETTTFFLTMVCMMHRQNHLFSGDTFTHFGMRPMRMTPWIVSR